MSMYEKIEEEIKTFLKKLDIEPDAIEVKEHTLHPIFSIKTKDPALLSGSRGEVLQALNHLIKQIVPQDNEESGQFLIDINNYQEEKLKGLEKEALLLAERARAFKRDVELAPMNAYERMVIHSLFTHDNHIDTTSVGEGRERRVVLKYTGI